LDLRVTPLLCTASSAAAAPLLLASALQARCRLVCPEILPRTAENEQAYRDGGGPRRKVSYVHS
jgi:hypothetical protein